jgi:hypothetical protein
MTSRIFVKPSHFFDEEAKESDKESGESDTDSNHAEDDEYDFDDGFLVPDDQVDLGEESKLSMLEFEEARSRQLLEEISRMKKKLKTLDRKLVQLHKTKKKWERRAKLSMSLLKSHNIV